MSRLHGLEIDEISFVDRPANQHGLVAITKRDEGPMAGTGLYDEDGNEFDDTELEAGMTAYDENGDVQLLLDDNQVAELEEQGYDLDNLSVEDFEDEDSDELVGVGKAGLGPKEAGFLRGSRRAAGRAWKTAKEGASEGTARGAASGSSRSLTNRQVGYGATAAVAGGYGAGRVRKSLGQDLLTSLSKAYTDGDRDKVIANSFGQAVSAVEKADRRADQAMAIAKRLEDQAELGEYIELAKGYELPIDPVDLGEILQTIAKSGLSAEQLDAVDRIFSAAGELIYLEEGFSGRSESPTMEMIGAYANEVVGKADVSPEQATVAVLSANPSAYEDYLVEERI